MKTETDRLREATEEQYRKERFEELQLYIDKLMAEMEVAYKAHNRYFKYEMMALALWILTAILTTNEVLEQIAWLLWFGLFTFDWFYSQPRIIKSLAKLDSCFETLRILGLLNKDDDNGKRKLRRFRDNPIERLWAKIKRQKQEEVYGTA